MVCSRTFTIVCQKPVNRIWIFFCILNSIFWFGILGPLTYCALYKTRLKGLRATHPSPPPPLDTPSGPRRGVSARPEVPRKLWRRGSNGCLARGQSAPPTPRPPPLRTVLWKSYYTRDPPTQLHAQLFADATPLAAVWRLYCVLLCCARATNFRSCVLFGGCQRELWRKTRETPANAADGGRCA